MAILRKTLLGLLAALLVAPAAVRAADVVVKDVRIEGNRRTDPEAIRAAIRTEPGKPLDLDQVDADIQAVMKIGSFADVVVELEGSPSAPVVVFRVAERPTVREVQTVGNAELEGDELKDAISLKPNAVYDRAAADKDVRAIQKAYADEGYFLANVTVKTEEAPDNQVDVTYLVDEHAKVEIKELRFVGNDHVPKEDLLPFMQNREGGLLPWSGGGTFREEALDMDAQGVQAVYLDRGYVEVKVGKPSVQLSADRRHIFITIPIVEGRQYDIGKVSFSGELLDQEKKLQKLLKVRTGERFKRSEVASTLLAVQDVYRDMGYAYVNVEPRTRPHPETRRVDLEFEVQPGQLVRIGRIDVVGNLKTRDKVIRRELRVYEGELFSGTGFKASRERVMALGFFETVDIAQTRRSPDTMDLVVTVKERPTGSFQVGAGYSSSENFVLTGQIAQQNFFGWGNSLTLQIQWSSIRQLGQISFEEPYFLDTRWTFSFDLYANQTEYTAFTRSAVGGSLTWGYELAGLGRFWDFAKKLEDVRLFATYTDERVSVATSNEVELARASGSGNTSSLKLTLNADKRDNRITPSDGWYGSFSFETAPQWLSPRWLFGRDVNLFNRYTLDLRAYRPLGRGIVGRVRLNMGWLQALTDEGVPLSELYFLGGVNSVRGYRLNSIAPRGVQACNDSPFADLCTMNGEGYQQVILNVEAEFPLAQKAGIRGVVFFDAGNAFSAGSYRDDRVSLNLYKSLGFGFRWQSPLGPLRFEWGIPLDRRKNVVGDYIDEPLDFQFTIGNFF
ncbi:MAG TPA: outer membrane protein assembly factor BamA [Anaeromyxobacter sp.]|nr:outer membrane protein assembly factor BamA [Anaeromyxobacter sp.]